MRPAAGMDLTCAGLHGPPRSAQLQGERHGESTTFHLSSENNNADLGFHADLNQKIATSIQEAGSDPKMLHEARSHPDWPR